MRALALLILAQATIGPIIKPGGVTVTGRPTPNTATAGGLLWDLDGGQLIYNDGTTWLPVDTTGGSGSANFVSGTATFDGGSIDTTATVTAAWASGSSSLVCSADGEEASIEGLQVVATSKSAGSFTVRAKVDQRSHSGDLSFVCTGN